MKFKLLHGTYTHGGKRYKPGMIIETDIDLAKRFNGPAGMPKKFDRLHDDHPINEDGTDPMEPVSDDGGSDDGLDSLNVEELKQYAASENVDLGNARTKAQILATIRKAVKL